MLKYVFALYCVALPYCVVSFPVVDHDTLERARRVRLRLGIERHATAFKTALEAVCQRIGEQTHFRRGRWLLPAAVLTEASVFPFVVARPLPSLQLVDDSPKVCKEYARYSLPRPCTSARLKVNASTTLVKNKTKYQSRTLYTIV